MTPRLLVVALDGGDAGLLEELERAGRLPTLACLRRRGAAVEVDTAADLLPDSSVWPPLMTGGAAAPSGVLHFEDFVPETMGTAFKHEAPPAIEPFWLHLPDRGRGTLVLDVPEIHFHPGTAADEACCWHMFSPTHRPAFSSPELARRLRRLGRPPPLPYPSRESTLEEERRFSRRLVDSVEARLRTALALETGYDTVCLGVHELHAALHWLGHHAAPGHWYRREAREPELVAAVYEAVDRELAPLLARFAGGNVAVVVMRGMRPANGAEQLLEGLLARARLLELRSAGRGPGGPRGERAWLTESLRAAIPAGLRERVAVRLLPQDVQYRLASRRFRDSYVWERTRAFPVPSWTTGGIRVNLRGREAAGSVAAGEVEDVLATVEALLAETVDADTGRPLARPAIRAREAFPEWRQLPDLLVDWAGDRPARAARHPRLGTWTARPRNANLWTVHNGRGLVLLGGPTIAPLEQPVRCELAGAAATFLALRGVDGAFRTGPWREVLAGRAAASTRV